MYRIILATLFALSAYVGAIEITAPGGITEVSKDTSPQLGGDLDVNGNDIVSTSNGDILINPNGTGGVGIGTTDADANQVHSYGKTLNVESTGASVFSTIQQQSGAGLMQHTYKDSDARYSIYMNDGALEAMIVEDGGFVGIGTSNAASKLHVYNGDIEISTNTGTNGIKHQTGQTQVDSGVHLIDNTLIAANTAGYELTSLDAAGDMGYIIEGFIENNAGASVTYDLILGTHTTGTDYNGERSIITGGTEANAEVTDNHCLITGASGEDTWFRIDITHAGNWAFYKCVSRDGTPTGIRIIEIVSLLEQPITTFTSLKVEASGANGIGVNSTFRTYAKR